MIFTNLTWKSFCEIRLKEGQRGVAAVLPYEFSK
ncbi:TPA: Hok/Gef family protein [Salmonella enterica subsp. enterica serovar Typhimurium]|nr:MULTISPECIES: Hok/Gef family protein [Enterobacteriaceae]MDM2752395.1 Hok/Gef family protein [Citrobacter sp. Cpo221]